MRLISEKVSPEEEKVIIPVWKEGVEYSRYDNVFFSEIKHFSSDPNYIASILKNKPNDTFQSDLGEFILSSTPHAMIFYMYRIVLPKLTAYYKNRGIQDEDIKELLGLKNKDNRDAQIMQKLINM